MSGTTHVRYEIIRTFRNRLTLAVTLALPLVLYYSIASGNRHATSSGISFPLYFMTGMAAYTLSASVVEIRDDGVGDPAVDGNGLTGLRERAAAVGGLVEAGPLRPRGWCLRVSVSPEVAVGR